MASKESACWEATNHTGDEEDSVKEIRVKNKVPPELIEAVERGHFEGIQFEPGDFDGADEPLHPVAEAEWILEQVELDDYAAQERRDTVSFELIQRKGTTVLYVIEVSEDGKKVIKRSSDVSVGVQMGRPVG